MIYLKTFIISLVVFVVASFLGNKINPYTPWGVKASKNEWISGSVFVVLLIVCGIGFVAAIVAWFIFVAFTIGKFFVFLGAPELGLMLSAIAWFGPILWWWYDGKLPSVDPHSWGCGDKGPP